MYETVEKTSMWGVIDAVDTEEGTADVVIVDDPGRNRDLTNASTGVTLVRELSERPELLPRGFPAMNLRGERSTGYVMKAPTSRLTCFEKFVVTVPQDRGLYVRNKVMLRCSLSV